MKALGCLVVIVDWLKFLDFCGGDLFMLLLSANAQGYWVMLLTGRYLEEH